MARLIDLPFADALLLLQRGKLLHLFIAALFRGHKRLITGVGRQNFRFVPQDGFDLGDFALLLRNFRGQPLHVGLHLLLLLLLCRALRRALL